MESPESVSRALSILFRGSFDHLCQAPMATFVERLAEEHIVDLTVQPLALGHVRLNLRRHHQPALMITLEASEGARVVVRGGLRQQRAAIQVGAEPLSPWYLSPVHPARHRYRRRVRCRPSASN